MFRQSSRLNVKFNPDYNAFKNFIILIRSCFAQNEILLIFENFFLFCLSVKKKVLPLHSLSESNIPLRFVKQDDP